MLSSRGASSASKHATLGSMPQMPAVKRQSLRARRAGRPRQRQQRPGTPCSGRSRSGATRWRCPGPAACQRPRRGACGWLPPGRRSRVLGPAARVLRRSSSAAGSEVGCASLGVIIIVLPASTSVLAYIVLAGGCCSCTALTWRHGRPTSMHALLAASSCQLMPAQPKDDCTINHMHLSPQFGDTFHNDVQRSL